MQVQPKDDLVHEVVEAVTKLVDSNLASPDERMAALLRLYEECPTYAATTRFRRLLTPRAQSQSEAAQRFWGAVRRYLLAENSAVFDPMGYSLWVDWFQDLETSEFAWNQLVKDQVAPRALSRLLIISGPVPWPEKAPLLWHVANHRPELHDDAADAVIFAMVDLFGSCDLADALRLAKSLAPAPELAGEMRRRLAIECGIRRDAKGRRVELR